MDIITRLILNSIKMKYKIFNLAFLSLFCAFLATSCKKNEILEKSTSVFRPIRLQVDTTTTMVLISWADLKEDNLYAISLSTTDDQVLHDTIEQKFISVELAGGTTYTVKVTALRKETKLASDFAELSFRTPTENLFQDFITTMSDRNEGQIKWLPEAAATALVLTPSKAPDTPLEVEISTGEKSVGTKKVTNLPNDTYRVELYNNKILRGTTTLVVEGDIYLPSGGDLVAAIVAAPNNGVVLLENDGHYLTNLAGSKYNFDKSVKIRGISPDKQASIYTSASYSASDVYGVKSGSNLERLEFENIIFNGNKGNIEANGNARYLFRLNSGTTNVKKVSFINCVLKNYEITSFMLAGGGAGNSIDTLNITGSIIENQGFGGSNGVISFTGATDHIYNIFISNSTFFKLQNQVIAGNLSKVESVLIENSTFNQVALSESKRFIFDFTGATSYGAGQGIRISTSLFGETAAGLTRGARTDDIALAFTSSFNTSDYDDSAGGSFKGQLTSYNGSSKDLWTNPQNGDFTFKDKSFTGMLLAGDPRWR